MIEYKKYFKDKRITVVGLGLLGRGLGDVRFLAAQGADLIVTDLKDSEALNSSLQQLRDFPHIHYTLGHHDKADFQDRDLILNGPAVPLDSPYIAWARSRGIPITMSVALFARLVRQEGAMVIGVTGTRGKSTTTYLIADIARTTGRRVLLGGNIQGISTLALLPEVTRDTIVVLELDSWQLQGFRQEKLSPDIAVFTTLYPDHLNYYHGDMDLYLRDKAEIFLHQSNKDTLILGEQVSDIVQKKYAGQIESHVIVTNQKDVPDDWQLRIPGIHNRANAACAIAVGHTLGIGEERIRAACEGFEGIAGRLQFVRELRGISIYNDTTATTPEATIAGLRALDPEEKRNTVLIMGGADKGLNMSALVPEISLHCKKAILLAGSGTEKIRGDLGNTPVYHTLESALRAALDVSSVGDVILFSPAFASFGMFKNEYDRGEQFMHAVQELS